MDFQIWKGAVSNSPSIGTALHSIRIRAIGPSARRVLRRPTLFWRSVSHGCVMRRWPSSASASTKTLRTEISLSTGIQTWKTFGW